MDKYAKDGGPAFPQPQGLVEPWAPGMSLRDYFAAKAMAAYILARNTSDDWSDADIAEFSYEAADAMLAEGARNGRGKANG